ncbi:hypothetical protein D8674_004247 [Pyrus ussuriensis x Pyrus communis]|uniref:Uncharacterized protein n=1 Tax=Pyrus ussuriensis x Pyrus communis TaxID=2448454 RepID=A0A5N5FPR3_9ROSA|nr:hypothetical protein D8674_004247 [Pyrus ussuriensis x Pyrus communis]
MEEEGTRALGLKVSRDAKTLYATLFPVLTSLLMVVLFLWTITSESGPADRPWMKRESYNRAFCVGLLTIVLGFLFLVAGLPLLVDLVIKFSEQLQRKQEETRKPQNQGKLKTICIVSRIVVSIIAMVMLAWAINTGFRLATEPKREDKYFPLASPVGVVTIMFGFTYSIIGLCVIAELALELTNQFQTTEENEIVNHQVRIIKVKCLV